MHWVSYHNCVGSTDKLSYVLRRWCSSYLRLNWWLWMEKYYCDVIWKCIRLGLLLQLCRHHEETLCVLRGFLAVKKLPFTFGAQLFAETPYPSIEKKINELLVFWYCDSLRDSQMITFGWVVRDVKLTLACCYVWTVTPAAPPGSVNGTSTREAARTTAGGANIST